MRADDHRAILPPAAQVVQDLVFGTAVHRRQRVVEDQDLRIQQQRTRNGDTLFLPARQHHAAFAHFGVIALRQPQNVLMDAGQPRRLFNLRLRRPGWPSAMLFATVSENRNGVWLTTDSRERQSSSLTCGNGRP